MNELSLYEKKIISDKEFPVQILENHIRKMGIYCHSHWHEHLELHYILNGTGVFYCNQTPFTVKEGDLLIINSNELHQGISNTFAFDSLVIIFEIGAFSKEVASCNAVFQSLIEADETVQGLLNSIYQEEKNKKLGYKLAIKGKIYELITCLLRNYVTENLSDKENEKRSRNLLRLNTVIKYIQDNYKEPITNKMLSELIHLSESRFIHIFRESMGMSPLKFTNEIRLQKAFYLLQQQEMKITDVATSVGFYDFNNFRRQFNKYYGCAPSKIFNRKNG